MAPADRASPGSIVPDPVSDLRAARAAAIAALCQPVWESTTPDLTVLIGDAEFAVKALRLAIIDARNAS